MDMETIWGAAICVACIWICRAFWRKEEARRAKMSDRELEKEQSDEAW